MKKEFDFDDIGKKTPYRVPEGFFDEMQRNVRKHTYGGKRLFSGKVIEEGRCWIPGIVRRRPLLINGFVKCRTRSWKSSSASPKAIYF